MGTTSSDATARIWDATTDAQLALVRGHLRRVNTVAFSSDGRWLVTTSDDRTARIWDAAQGTEFFVLSGHEGAVHTAMFSPDGQRIVTGAQDGTAHLACRSPASGPAAP